MKTRIISAVIGIPLVVLALYFHHYFPLCLNIVCALASLICSVELLNAKSLTKDYIISVPCMLFASLLPMLVVTELLWQWLIYGFVFYLVSLLIVKNQKYNFNDIAYLVTAIGLSTSGFSTLVATTQLDAANSCFLVVLCIATAWIADAGAYFVGSACGKHKLCPNVSPKKTIEGAIGGVIIGTLGAICVACVYYFFIFRINRHPHNWVGVDFVGVAIVGAISTITSMIGDLTFSLIKRSCNVKDYGNIIPGHGGILDRCDSIIMTAPLLFLFAQNWPLTMVCN